VGKRNDFGQEEQYMDAIGTAILHVVDKLVIDY
jgi:hypothetical protein